MYTLGIPKRDYRRATQVLSYESQPSIPYHETLQDDGFYLFTFPEVGSEDDFRDVVVKLKGEGIRVIGADAQLTERQIMKLIDCFMGLSFPFYYGAPNVSNFFPENSYKNIDIYDLKKSIEIIEGGINNNFYEKNLEALVESKNLACREYNLFYRLSKISKSIVTKEKNSNKRTKIKNLEIYQQKYEKKQKNLQKMFNILRKIKTFLLKRK